MAGLFDFLSAGPSSGGLLDFLSRNSMASIANNPGAMPSDMAQYGGAPSSAMAYAQPQIPQNPPPVISAQPSAAPASAPSPSYGSTGLGGNLLNPLLTLTNSRGLIPALGNTIASIATGQRMDPTGIALQQQQLSQNLTARALLNAGVPADQIAAAIQPGNGDLLKTLIANKIEQKPPMSIGEGHLYFPSTGKTVQAYDPEDKTPQSVLEYQYYLKGLKPGDQPMDYATFSTAKARAGATNIQNNFDPNATQSYDKQLAEGLGKAHAGLANGVEEAQGRARDIAAMQGAIDAIQKRGGTTGGLGQQQILDLQKTLNAGASAIGLPNPFSESDLADKEFLTKFNRQLAGQMAKNAAGSRVTNFEMSNYLKANPGLDMSVTGNQRLLGIQAQIEQRNIAVGNAIRAATAQSISSGGKIDPVTVQKIITDYDQGHHIKDPVTGQDLTQSYALPEFQQGGTNPALAQRHGANIGKIRRYNPATGQIE